MQIQKHYNKFQYTHSLSLSPSLTHTHTVILCYLDQHFKREDACENVVKITQHLQSNTTPGDMIIILKRQREKYKERERERERGG